MSSDEYEGLVSTSVKYNKGGSEPTESTHLIVRTGPYKHRWTPFLMYCNFAGVIGSSFLFGYQTVLPNEPFEIFRGFINSSFASHHDSEYLNQDDLDGLWTLTVSLFLLGGIFGALLGGPESNYFGRKKSLLINCFIGIIAGVLQFSSPYVDYYELMLIGRAVSGIHCGLVSAVVPAYLVELAPVSLRGSCGTINQVAICFGGVSAGILGLPVVLGQIDKPSVWPFLSLPCLVLPVVQFFMLLVAVESPRWLLVIKGNNQDAGAALWKLRGDSTPYAVIEAEIKDLQLEEEALSWSPVLGIFESLRGAFGWPLVICVMMHLTQQLCGINAVMYYSSIIFTEAGLEAPIPEYASLGVVTVASVVTIISGLLAERLGRRSLMIIGTSGAMAGCAALTLCMTLASVTGIYAFNILTIVSMIIYNSFFGIGPGPVPWYVAAELSLLQYRPTVMSVCAFVNWTANLACAFFFPPLQKALGTYSFLPFFGLLVLFDIFAILYLPETKGKTPEEMIRKLGKRRIQIKTRCR